MKHEDNHEGFVLIKCLYVFALMYFLLDLLFIFLQYYVELFERRIGTGIPLMLASAPSIGMYIYYKNWHIEKREIAKLFFYFVLAVAAIDYFVPALVSIYEYGYVEGIRNFKNNFEDFSIQLLAWSTVSLSIFHYLFLWFIWGLLALIYVGFTKLRKL